MRRRDFITLLGGAVAPWPRSARAQQKVPVIGFIGTTSPTAWREQIAAFEQRLGELGWASGRTITIEYRWTEGRNEQAPAIAQAFVERGVDIIVAGGNAVAAAKQATSSIPIVFPVAVDPLGSGFVASLSRPGGNVTGLSLQGGDVAGKRLQTLREIVRPGGVRGQRVQGIGRRVGVLHQVKQRLHRFRLRVLEVDRVEIEMQSDH